VASVLDFAFHSQPNVSQNPQCWHGVRPRYGLEITAIGVGAACQPSFRAPTSSSTPDGLIGSGGSGYGRERGGSNGFAPASPLTPSSHSPVAVGLEVHSDQPDLERARAPTFSACVRGDPPRESASSSP
jgi:hypothetical protein